MLFTLGEELVDVLGEGEELLVEVLGELGDSDGEHDAPTRTAATAGDNDEGVELGEGIDALIDKLLRGLLSMNTNVLN